MKQETDEPIELRCKYHIKGYHKLSEKGKQELRRFLAWLEQKEENDNTEEEKRARLRLNITENCVTKKILPNNFKILRKKNKLTLRELESKVGFSNSWLSQLENGHNG
jgi:DNA-binding PadR family transcriptional regulator